MNIISKFKISRPSLFIEDFSLQFDHIWFKRFEALCANSTQDN